MTQNLRPSTNLVIPEHLMLPKKDLKSRFMHVYNKGFAGSPVMFMTKLWASSFFPSMVSDPSFGVGRKRSKIADNLQKLVAYSYLRVKIEREIADPHVLVSAPMFSFNIDLTTLSIGRSSTCGVFPLPWHQ